MTALAMRERVAGQPPAPPTPPTPSTPPPPDAPLPGDVLGDQPPTFVIPDSLGDAMETGMQVLFGIVLLLVVVWPLVRLFVRRMERRMITWQLPPELDVRLTRIEQGVDAIAIEVERVSEAQRFSARLMSEREPVRVEGAARLPEPGR